MGFKTLNNFENIYVTGDLHLSNTVNRTIAYRGFNDAKEHTKYIRNVINSTIKSKSDTLYILGDVGFKDNDEELMHFIKSLTPRVKISLGNHDSERQLKRFWSMGVIEDFKHDYKIRWNGNLFHLTHLPLLEWEGFFRNGYLCHAHTHGNQKPYLRSWDVGLDNNNMKILNLQEIINLRSDFNNIDNSGNKIELF